MSRRRSAGCVLLTLILRREGLVTFLSRPYCYCARIEEYFSVLIEKEIFGIE